MIYGFRFFAEDFSFESTRINETKNYPDILNLNAHGKDSLNCFFSVISSQEVEIDLKCFKFDPPPPGFRPCPEAGKIILPKKLEKNGRAQFLIPLIEEFKYNNDYFNNRYKEFLLNLKDYDSDYSIIIHLNF